MNATTLSGSIETATQSGITTLSNLVTVGTLDIGSITSGFGDINIGENTITAGEVKANKISNVTEIGNENIQTRILGSAVVNGTLIVESGTVLTTVDNLIVDDPLVLLGRNNIINDKKQGIITEYGNHTGAIINDGSTGNWQFFDRKTRLTTNELSTLSLFTDDLNTTDLATILANIEVNSIKMQGGFIKIDGNNTYTIKLPRSSTIPFYNYIKHRYRRCYE